ncbi:hypothetical protein K431DRAFT_222263 [Polychaeton citri CBS 116435]|uniref:Transmembrane protein UsgS n=1 Tax=Polychaeton citri CBS 116435 TaxID=1314669 RepID=A0A9P4QCI0_9PEZI|nr:hypothetical protein K431DRAFT_222263 [Polychaeton citri CBS 116435]
MSSPEEPSKEPEASGFDPNAILRGAQLTIVGSNRALQNPGLFTSQHYRQAALAVAAGIAIRLVIAIPTLLIRLTLKTIGLFADLDGSTWDEDVIEGLEFIEHSVLQIPFFLMSFMRYLSPTMDNVFMDSLDWVDRTYIQKHKGENPDDLRAMYYPNLKLYDGYAWPKQKKEGMSKRKALQAFLMRFGRKAALSLAIYAASFLPYVGKLVLPAASFYTFNRSAGLGPAVAVFGSGLVLPKRYLVMFLQSYFSSRSLMRELLEPYFSRIHYDKAQKRAWFHDREGVLYGFALAFFMMIKVPLVGVLVYGIAEASTAYLITKITEPPPLPADVEHFKQNDVRWHYKQAFLDLPLEGIDHFNIGNVKGKLERHAPELKGKAFT